MGEKKHRGGWGKRTYGRRVQYFYRIESEKSRGWEQCEPRREQEKREVKKKTNGLEKKKTRTRSNINRAYSRGGGINSGAQRGDVNIAFGREKHP